MLYINNNSGKERSNIAYVTKVNYIDYIYLIVSCD